MNNKITIILDKEQLKKYNQDYFAEHPRARKAPIQNPYHPSINAWFILKRVVLNSLKQKWKYLAIWLAKPYVKEGIKFDKFKMTVYTYMPTKRKFDLDNCCPKFLLDGFVVSGLLKDDSVDCLQEITLKGGYDRENPRTEIYLEEIN